MMMMMMLIVIIMIVMMMIVMSHINNALTLSHRLQISNPFFLLLLLILLQQLPLSLYTSYLSCTTKVLDQIGQIMDY